MSSISTYYKILGLDITASPAEIKTAYRNLAKKWHPDRFVSQPEKLAQAEQEIQKINQAYEILKNYIPKANNNDSDIKLKSQKSDASYHYNLGVQLAEQEDYQCAISEFSQAIKLNNKYIKAYQYRGFIFSKLGYEHRADADFQKVSEIKLNTNYKPSTEAKTKGKDSHHTSKYYHNSQNSAYSNQKTKNKNYNPTSNPNHNNIKSWKCIRTILAHKNAVSSILISSDNQLLITGSYDKSIKIWELSTGQIIDTLQGHSEAITCLAISNDNKTLISGSRDKTIRFWYLKQKKVVKTFGGWFSGHSQAMISVVIDSKNNVLLSASADNLIKIWDLKQSKEIKEINCKSGQITSLAINQNQGYFCNSGLEKQIRIRNTKTGEVIRSLRGDSGVTSLTFSKDGKFLATGEINRQIKIFDMTTGKIIKTFLGHTDRISSLIFSTDSKQLISVGWDSNIKVWDIAKEIELETLTAHKDRILSLAITSDGRNIISGSSDRSIRIWQP